MNEDLDSMKNVIHGIKGKKIGKHAPYPEKYAFYFDQEEAMQINPEQVLRAELLCRLIDGKAHECGAASGYITNKARKEYDRDITCSDISPYYAKKAKDLYDIDMDIADIEELPYDDNEFDTVIAGEILEHLDDPGKGLSECVRCAKKRVLITLPTSSKFENDPTHKWFFRLHNIVGDLIVIEMINIETMKRDPIPDDIREEYKQKMENFKKEQEGK